MTTKKQKHQAALEKRERMLAAERKVGQEALRRDQADRERQARAADSERRRRRDSEASKKLNAMFSKGSDDLTIGEVMDAAREDRKSKGWGF